MSRLFHVNLKTGKAGKCTASLGKCPFGAADVHFTSESAARNYYEALNSKNSIPSLSRTKTLSATPNTKSAFEASVADFFPNTSKVVIPPKVDRQINGQKGDSLFIGGKFYKLDSEGKVASKEQNEVMTEIRQDIKEAKRLNEIPQWLNLSVRKDNTVWTKSVAIVIGMKTGRELHAIPEKWLYKNGYDEFDGYTKEASIMKTYIQELARQYSYIELHPQSDGFNSLYNCRVSFRSKREDK